MNREVSGYSAGLFCMSLKVTQEYGKLMDVINLNLTEGFL